MARTGDPPPAPPPVDLPGYGIVPPEGPAAAESDDFRSLAGHAGYLALVVGALGSPGCPSAWRASRWLRLAAALRYVDLTGTPDGTAAEAAAYAATDEVRLAWACAALETLASEAPGSRGWRGRAARTVSDHWKDRALLEGFVEVATRLATRLAEDSVRRGQAWVPPKDDAPTWTRSTVLMSLGTLARDAPAHGRERVAADGPDGGPSTVRLATRAVLMSVQMLAAGLSGSTTMDTSTWILEGGAPYHGWWVDVGGTLGRSTLAQAEDVLAVAHLVAPEPDVRRPDDDDPDDPDPDEDDVPGARMDQADPVAA